MTEKLLEIARAGGVLILKERDYYTYSYAVDGEVKQDIICASDDPAWERKCARSEAWCYRMIAEDCQSKAEHIDRGVDGFVR